MSILHGVNLNMPSFSLPPIRNDPIKSSRWGRDMGHRSRQPGPALSPEHCIQLCHERPSCTVAATAARNQGSYSDTRGDGWSRSRLHLRPCPGSPRIPSTEQIPAPVPSPNRVLATAARRRSPPRAAARCCASPLAAPRHSQPPRATQSRPAPPPTSPCRFCHRSFRPSLPRHAPLAPADRPLPQATVGGHHHCSEEEEGEDLREAALGAPPP